MLPSNPAALAPKQFPSPKREGVHQTQASTLKSSPGNFPGGASGEEPKREIIETTGPWFPPRADLGAQRAALLRQLATLDAQLATPSSSLAGAHEAAGRAPATSHASARIATAALL